jgi:hypothetical protein
LKPGGQVVVRIALRTHEEEAFADRPVLPDALEDAGCTNAGALGHRRGPGRADRVHLRVGLEVGQVVGGRPPRADRPVRLAGVGGGGVPQGRLDRLRNLGVGDG